MKPDTPQAVLAWPRYDDATRLDDFFDVFARVISGRDDVVLFLRLDPELDPPRQTVIEQLEECHARILGQETLLNIQMLENALTPEEWREVSAHLTCRIRCTSEAEPRHAARELATPVAGNAASLERFLAHHDTQTHREESRSTGARVIEANEQGVILSADETPDPGLVAHIEALNPWLYPVNISGMTVIPGVGSKHASDWLANRMACRSTNLVEEVLQRIDFSGKTVLDLGCNCAFWSAQYATAGASRVFGIDCNARHIEQAELYWKHGEFLTAGSYEFQPGDISAREDWSKIRESGPFDVTLCAGSLDELTNVAAVLRWAAEVTREVLIIETSVPDDVGGNTRAGSSSMQAHGHLLPTLRELGFEAEFLAGKPQRQFSIDEGDSYSESSRMTIVAHKVPVRASRFAEAPMFSQTARKQGE